MKKFLLLFCVASIFILSPLSSCKSTSEEDSTKSKHKQTYLDESFDFESIEVGSVSLTEEDAFDAVKNMRAGVNFGNSLDTTSYDVDSSEPGWMLKYPPKEGEWETKWGQPVITKKLVKAIKAQGFNAIRVPVTWAEHIDENNQIDSKWMARVKEVVNWVLEEDLYCLLNTHHDGGTGGWVRASTEYYNRYKERYAAVYTQIANEFKDCSEKLVLCGTNEMIYAAPKAGGGKDENWNNASADSLKAINLWNQLFVYTVRKTGGNNAKRNLMVGTYCCSTLEENLKGFERPNDLDENHLIMEVHCYSPQDFTWEKESWLPNWTTKWQSYFESLLDDEFKRVKKYSGKYNMPIIIGEWGTLGRRFPGTDEKTGDPKWESTTDEEGTKFTKCFISKTYEKGFCCFYWDTAELINRETGEAKSPLMIKGIMDSTK